MLSYIERIVIKVFDHVGLSWHYLKSTLPVFAISALWQYAEAR